MSKAALAGSILVMGAAASPGARADVLTDPGYQYEVLGGFAGLPEFYALGVYSATGSEGQPENVTIQGAPFSAITVSATSTKDYGAGVASASGDLTYFFEVVGAGSGTVELQAAVTMDISQHLTGATLGETMAEVIANNEIGPVTSYELDLESSGSETWSGVLTFEAQLNTPGSILIEAGTYSNGDSQPGDSGTGRAYIDPYITFVGPQPGDTLEISPGIGNAPAVPEPSTWAIMLAGFAGIGLAARRRRITAPALMATRTTG